MICLNKPGKIGKKADTAKYCDPIYKAYTYNLFSEMSAKSPTNAPSPPPYPTPRPTF